jgi:hypothetical protein
MLAILYAAHWIEKQMRQDSDQSKADAQSSDSDGSSSDSQDTQGYSDTVKILLKGTRRRDPTDSAPSSTTLTSDLCTERKWNMPDRLQWPEHPHAIIEDATELRSVQQGAKYPHTTAEHGFTTQHNDEPEWDRLR